MHNTLHSLSFFIYFLRPLLVFSFGLACGLYCSNDRNETFNAFFIIHLRTVMSKITFLVWYYHFTVFINYYLYILSVRKH
jgi:hypothetical protein